MGSLSWVQWEQTGTGLCSSETPTLGTNGEYEHGCVAKIRSSIALEVVGCILEIAFFPIDNCSDSIDQALLKLEAHRLLQGVEAAGVTELITECMKSVVASC